ncbi:MAG: alanine dehydrogenase [Cyclobacteriaceae bacterium]
MVDRLKENVVSLAAEQALYPKEAPAKLKNTKGALIIGIPKECSYQENRVALNPESVRVLVNNGHTVRVETNAGKTANYLDNEYSEAGAEVIYTRREVFQAELIFKVEPPTLEEIELMREGVSIISALQSGNQTVDFLMALNRKRITALAYEFVEDKVGGLPVVRAMSEIAGSSVMLIAAEYLSSSNNGLGIILGGITGVPPTKVVILGAGTVAEYAARAALGLGVDIAVFDNQIYKLRRIKHALNHQVYTSTIDHSVLQKAIADADVLIGAMRPEKGRHKCVVTEEMVASMKDGAVVIDVGIDQGGCIETSDFTTHDKPVFTKHGVIHYCVPNIASRVARTATNALSNIFTPMILQIGDAGGMEEMIFSQKWFMKGIYAHRGGLTNVHLARKYNLPFKDLNLLIAARF